MLYAVGPESDGNPRILALFLWNRRFSACREQYAQQLLPRRGVWSQ